MLVSNRHDGIHVACYTGIVNRHDDLSTRRDEGLQRLGIEVRIALHAIGKHHFRPFAQESQSGRDEGIGRDDDLIARPEIA